MFTDVHKSFIDLIQKEKLKKKQFNRDGTRKDCPQFSTITCTNKENTVHIRM